MKRKKQYSKEKAIKRMSRNVVGQPKPTTAIRSKKNKQKYKDRIDEERSNEEIGLRPCVAVSIREVVGSLETRAGDTGMKFATYILR